MTTKTEGKETEIKSQCCDAPIRVDKGGVGLFSLVTGALICTKCRKYCYQKR